MANNNNWLQAIETNVLAPNEGNNWNNRGTVYSNTYNYAQEYRNWQNQLERAHEEWEEERLDPRPAENNGNPRPVEGGKRRRRKNRKSRKGTRKSRKGTRKSKTNRR